METNTQQRRGFTLIEIMAVVLIIGLLTTLVGIAIVPRIEQGRVTTARTQIKMLDAAVEMYRMDNIKVPTTEQGLRALIDPPADARNFQTGGYLREKRVPVDPWGNEGGRVYSTALNVLTLEVYYRFARLVNAR